MLRKTPKQKDEKELSVAPDSHHGKEMEPITAMLKYIGNEAIIVDELFELWRLRKGRSYDPELDRLSQESRERRKQKQRVSYLKRKELLRIEKKEDKLIARLSKKGEQELWKRTINERPELSFGQECLVVYDFPTSARSGRDLFRKFLKSLGFEQVQKSVWKSKKDVFKDVERFVNELNVGDWVKLYVAQGL